VLGKRLCFEGCVIVASLSSEDTDMVNERDRPVEDNTEAR
jgi:hypothetical protein